MTEKPPLRRLGGDEFVIIRNFNKIREGQIYRHYQNNQFYKITGFYRDTQDANNIEKVRIGYQQLYPPFEKFQRLIREFCSEVQVNGKFVKKFQLVLQKDLLA